jgi:hypothetical protein
MFEKGVTQVMLLSPEASIAKDGVGRSTGRDSTLPDGSAYCGRGSVTVPLSAGISQWRISVIDSRKLTRRSSIHLA